MIRYEVIDQVAKITLDRPDKYHSFNREMALELQAKFTLAKEDHQVRSILLTSTGKAFCAGQDLGEATDPNGPELETIVKEHYNPMIKQIRNIDKPVICAVNGVAAGAGASIALCCDIVVANEDAVFIQAFSKIGLIPDSGATYFLPRLIGIQKATALMMTGEKISAQEALNMGMIYKVYVKDEFEKNSWDLAKNLANMPTKGLALTKKLLNTSYLNTLDKQLENEMEFQKIAGDSFDYKEGVAAFLEKRSPKFKGK